jgi:glycine cleavage system T protein
MNGDPKGSYESLLDASLTDDLDPMVSELIRLEDERQRRKIILIASESICPKPVHDAVASTFANIYAEGLPGSRMSRWDVDYLDDYSHQLSYLKRYTDRRYYKGCDYVNVIESLAQRRCAEAFANKNASADDIYVNVQPLSGAAANNAVYNAFVRPGETVMGMALDSGGHLSHGSSVNRSGMFHNVVSYTVDRASGMLDYDAINELAQEARPKLIIAGYSAWPRVIDWEAFKGIAEDVGAKLLADIAHPAGLVAAGEFPNPVGIVDAITFTTHKTMCGPRGAVVMSTDPELARLLDLGVFPGEQGGPHINQIAGKAVCFGIAQTDAFRNMQRQVKENARTLGKVLEGEGIQLAYGGTDCHYVMVDLEKVPTPTAVKPRGEVISRILDLCGITINKNTKAGDDSAVYPTAIRLGTTFMTQQGWGVDEFGRLGHIISQFLKGIHAFNYMGAAKPRGRGKMDMLLFEQVKREVEQLMLDSGILEVERISSGYPHYFRIPGRETGEPVPLLQGRVPKAEGVMAVDATAHGVTRVTGARARQFVQAVVTADVWRLRPHESARAYVLDDKGHVLDDVVVIREKPDERGRDRYLVLSHQARHDKIVGWLRYLSEGYIIFDHEDLRAKVDGPVVVEDLSNPADRRMCLMALKGKGSVKALAKILPALDLDIGKAAEVELDRATTIVNRSTWGGFDGFEVVCPAEHSRMVWEALLGAGGIPTRGDVLVAEPEDITHASAGMITTSKPYFVGHGLVEGILRPESDKGTWEWVDPGLEPRKSCLYDWHADHTKNIVPFAGWLMPVWYTKISEEHAAVRETAGLFDVSHMGVLEVRGEGAERFLDIVTTGYLNTVKPGEATYAYLLDPKGVPVDDIFIYRRAEDNFMIVVNAANAEKDLDWLLAVASKAVVIDEERPWVEIDCDSFEVRNLKDPKAGRDQRIDIALQGPRSLEILMEVMVDEQLKERVRKLQRNTLVHGAAAGVDVIISRTGYTGAEVGFELYVHPEDALQLWESLMKAGEPFGIMPAGLGARDSTRTEAGYPLYGHELAGDYSIGPFEAGYPQFVRTHHPFFIGRAPYLEREEMSGMRIARFKMVKRGIPVVRHDSPVANRQGHVVGYVTSCVTVADGSQVGLAYVKARSAEEGTRLGVFVPPRGKVSEPKHVHHLELGDRVPMAEEAEVLARFMAPTVDLEREGEEGAA